MAATLLSGGVAPLAKAAAPAFAGLEEITVTARKREENLQSTPVAVSAFSATTMAERQMFTINDVAQYAPNLQFSSGAGGTTSSSNFFIRGIGQLDFITTTEPGVGTYLDGIYLARVTGAAIDLADIERVEVLRGPQGTLFGRNTIGGAVNIVTAKPSGEFGGKGTVRVGNRGLLEGNFTVDFPIADTLFGKVSMLARSTDGWGRNNWPGADDTKLGRESDVAGRAQVRWLASGTLTFDLSADWSKERGTGMPHGMVAFTDSDSTDAFNPGAAVPIGPQYIVRHPDDIQVNTPMRDELDVFGISLAGTLDLGEASVKSITSYREQDGFNGQDYDGSPSAFLDQEVVLDQWQFSQELQVFGKSLDDRLDWLAGVYYFTEEGQFDSTIILTEIPVLIFTGNGTKSFAAFGQATYRLTDQVSATAGLRWTREKKNLDVTTTFGPFMLIDNAMVDDTFKALSPKFGLEYQASDEMLLYASVTWGFRSGGYNGRPFAPSDLTSFAEEKAVSYEVGVKSDWADNRVRLNVAAFYNDYTDIQVTATTQNVNGDFIVVTGNAAKAEIYGFEVELQARPTTELDIFASVGFTDNTLEEQPGFSFGSETLPNASKWSLSVGATYTLPVANFGEIAFGADYSYRSGFYPQFNTTPTSRENGYGLLNARIQFRPEHKPWQFALYGKNLTDEVYRTFGQTSGTNDTTIAWFGRTREIGAELRFDF
jgi:iron complex outermembrane receptor protein